MGKTITFKLDASSSLEDRRAFADSSAWWARYGVLVRFDGIEVGQALELVLKGNASIIDFEKHNPSNIVALRIPDSRKVLIIKSRVNNSKDMTGAYEKITNIRDNYLHNTSKTLVKEYDKIIIENLNVKSMMEAKGFIVQKSNIQDASWARFASQLKYKAEKAGKLIIEIDPKNTSKTCSKCLNLKDDLTLQDRTYQCKACGFELDRDHNAALNIKRLGTSLASNLNNLIQKPMGSSHG